jgi:hypothetical protein
MLLGYWSQYTEDARCGCHREGVGTSNYPRERNKATHSSPGWYVCPIVPRDAGVARRRDDPALVRDESSTAAGVHPYIFRNTEHGILP